MPGNYRAPHKCMVCGGSLQITEVTCTSCGSVLSGQFQPCKFCALEPEDLRFLEIFVRNRGNIKDIEREMGISYPTVRNNLDHLIRAMGLERAPQQENGGPEPPVSCTAQKPSDQGDCARIILERLSKKEISLEEAARQLNLEAR